MLAHTKKKSMFYISFWLPWFLKIVIGHKKHLYTSILNFITLLEEFLPTHTFIVLKLRCDFKVLLFVCNDVYIHTSDLCILFSFMPASQRFSCIIGPNGSGKSNVIDSMLFVFGYRAQKIRSKKLSVLIHSSDKHKDVQSCCVEVHFQKIIDKVFIFLPLKSKMYSCTFQYSVQM